MFEYFPCSEGIKTSNANGYDVQLRLNTFPVPKGLRHPYHTITYINCVFEYFPCSEGIKTE